MNRLILIFALLLPSFAWAGTCGNSYLFSRKILLTKAQNSDQTNFPVPLVGTYAAFADAAHGGQIQHSTTNATTGVTIPADMVFCDAASSGNVLKKETAYWNNTTGAFEIYLEQPTYHTASNDAVWVFANNSSVSTSQDDNSMWTDVNCVWIMHYPNGSSLNLPSSCPATGASSTTGTLTAAAAVTDGGMNSATSSRANYASNTGMNTLSAFTFEAWLSPASSYGGVTFFVDKGSGSSGTQFILGQQGGSLWTEYYDGADHDLINGSIATSPFSLWLYLVGRWNGTAIQNFINAVSTGGSTSYSATAVANTNPLTISGRDTGNYNPGIYDEVRGWSDAKSQDWLTNTFYLQPSGTMPISGYPSTSTRMNYQIIEPSYSSGTLVQYASCYATAIPFNCPLPFPKQAGTTLLPIVGGINDATTSISDTLGLTYTLQVSSLFVGTLQAYTTGIYTTPPSASSGADTFTFACSGCAGHDLSAIVMEVANATPTGLVTANSNASPTSAMSLTNPSNGSFLACTTQNSGAGPFTTSEGYASVVSPPADYPSSGLHSSNNTVPYANNVASGVQTCTISGGSGGTMIVLPFASPTSSLVKHRVTRH